MRAKSLLAALLLFGVIATPALAEDAYPPPWRGDARTAYARWEFGGPDMFPPPDEWYGPGNPPAMQIMPAGPWFPTYNGRDGVWVLSGELWADMSNYPEPNFHKYVWVQLTWAPWSGPEFPHVEEIATPGGPHPATIVQEFPIGPADWMHTTYLIELHPNPQFESIHVWGDIYVDEIVIDTVCDPDDQQLKWSQPPVELMPGNDPPIYHGWDERSLYPVDPAGVTVAADDWLCRTLKPVVAIRWWGSHLGWLGQSEPPSPDAPIAFHLGFWSNVPAGPNEPFSHPGVMVHEITVPVGIERLTIEWAGYDQMPDEPQIGDSCFRYSYWFYDHEWFYQNDPAGPAEPTIWWVSICAIYDKGVVSQYPWGCKTRPHYFQDDGVVITDYAPPCQWGVGAQWMWGRQIIWPPSGESYDLAFELYTTPDTCVDDWRLKWSQPAVQWAKDPQTFVGWDVPSTYTPGPTFPFPFVADDWRCENWLPAGGVRWWGSYLDWQGDMPPFPGIPSAFHLGFWTNVPAGPENPFSHPGTLLHEVFVPYEQADERWVGLDRPPWMAEPIESCFEYTACLPRSVWFDQRQFASPTDPTIWWLSVAAVYDPAVSVVHEWGWKTRPRFFEDDAVVTTDFQPIPLAVGGQWLAGYPIEDPSGVSWDVAFEVYAPSACDMADFDQDGDVDLDDFAVFAACYNGANRPPAPACPPGVNADLDGDGDVDLDDFSLFAACYTGAR